MPRKPKNEPEETSAPVQGGHGEPLAVFRGRDEVNLAQLALISVQSRVPETFTGWARSYEHNGMPVEVTCRTLRGHVVPHGLDNDFVVTIINLFYEAGCPVDDTVRVSAYRLLKTAGFPDTSRYYAELWASLDRLKSAQYVISRGWYSKKKMRYTDETFQYLEKVTLTRGNELDSRSQLEIRLPREIALSIRDGYLKPLDLDVYHNLSTPTIRAIYRVLDGLRWSEGQYVERVQMNVMEWAARLNIVSDIPARILRLLEPATEEFKRIGYVDEVLTEGKRKEQQITYVFPGLTDQLNVTFLQELIDRGMYPGVAARHLIDHPEERAVQDAIARFDAYPGKKGNPGALMRDLLLHPEKYAGVEQKLEGGGRRSKASERPKPAPVLAQSVPEDDALALPEDPDERVRVAEQRLSLFRVWPLLTGEDRDNLEHAVRTGTVALPVLFALLLRTVGENKADIADKVRSLVLQAEEDE